MDATDADADAAQPSDSLRRLASAYVKLRHVALQERISFLIFKVEANIKLHLTRAGLHCSSKQ